MSAQPDRPLQLQIHAGSHQAQLLEGLAVWRDLGLLPEADLNLAVALSATHPELLAGLAAWVKLGLLSEQQLRRLCREHLTCAVPVPALPTPAVALQPQQEFAPTQPSATDFAPAAAATQPTRSPASNFLSILFQRLGAELSVVWLLLLGVFLVVLSSGVLAASQWQRFSAPGQYLVLLVYTFGFWGASLWAGRQQNLHLTTQTLRLVGLLLIPVNFWAIDSLRVWSHPLGWLISAVAAIALSWVFNRGLETVTKSMRWVSMGSNFLHWGWGVTGLPIVAVYLATLAAIAVILHQGRQRSQPLMPLAIGIVLYGWVILLLRAMAIATTAWRPELGLAIATLGWLLGWLAAQQQSRQRQKPAGSSLPPDPLFLSASGFRWLGGRLALSGVGSLCSRTALAGDRRRWIGNLVFSTGDLPGWPLKSPEGSATTGIPVRTRGDVLHWGRDGVSPLAGASHRVAAAGVHHAGTPDVGQRYPRPRC
ncbi:hypothetical protein DO97_16645 [Neosynechococcus sphagnicola sy1]|uniref:DUF2157 domain-containing protein n=1 Tax=Neosynechococcus sphagnicola sy1 TaxID=1497020 RepID=A0A098TP21_9CYAN|nr:hypothetical protein [Neosynechococcus sphagnicola]KGF73607.1 hypothetical protein DO97_16645 [Neosynechococcus sphagnicola sy1]